MGEDQIPLLNSHRLQRIPDLLLSQIGAQAGPTSLREKGKYLFQARSVRSRSALRAETCASKSSRGSRWSSPTRFCRCSFTTSGVGRKDTEGIRPRGEPHFWEYLSYRLRSFQCSFEASVSPRRLV